MKKRWTLKFKVGLFFSAVSIVFAQKFLNSSDILSEVTTATTMAPTAEAEAAQGGGWLSSIRSYAARVSKKTLGTITELKPLCTFFVRAPINFMRAVKETKYSDRKFMIYQTPAARKAHEESVSSGEFEGIRGREFGDDGKWGYRIEYDFGFEGGGDINQPLGFRIVDGRYYYRPVKGRLVPGAIQFQGERTALDMSTSRGRILQYFMLKTLSFILGGKKRAVELWKGVTDLMTLKPEQIFMIKAFTLLAAGSRNSTAGTGYPRYGHVPTEMTLLFARLAETPDLQKCLELNDGVKYPSQWTRIERVDVSDLMARAVFPSIIKDLANVVKVPVEENEIQEMRDRKGKQLTDFQILYSKMRMTYNYNDRSRFGTNQFLAVDYRALNKTDRALYLYAVRKHVAERFKGLSQFVLRYIRDYEFGLAGEIKEASTGPEEVSLDVGGESEASDILPGGKMHIGSITGMIKDRVVPLKEFIRTAIDKFKEYRVSDSEIQYLRSVENNVDFQVKKIEDMGGAASVAEVAGDDEKAIGVANQLEQYLKQLAAQELVELSLGLSTRTVLLRFPDYLKLRAYQFEKILFQRFKGDVGFMFDDAYLGQKSATAHAMAIFLRAAKDQARAEELFKKDTRTYTMLDRNGNEVQIVGATLYQDKMVKAEQYLASAENSLTRAQSEAATGELTSDIDGLFNSATKASQVYQAYKSEFAFYLRQYPFDRRNLTSIRSRVDEIAAAIPTSGQEVIAKIKGLVLKRWAEERVKWESLKVRLQEEIGNFKLKIREEQRAYALAAKDEIVNVVPVVTMEEIAKISIRVDQAMATLQLLSLMAPSTEIQSLISSFQTNDFVIQFNERQRATQKLMDRMTALNTVFVGGRETLSSSEMGIRTVEEAERRRAELDNMIVALNRIEGSLDDLVGAISKVEVMASSETTATSVLSTSISLKGGEEYAKTINEFLGQEMSALLLRSKDFEKTCKLYLDPFLKVSLGTSTDELLQVAAGHQSGVEAEFNARFVTDLGGGVVNEEIPEGAVTTEFGIDPTRTITTTAVQETIAGATVSTAVSAEMAGAEGYDLAKEWDAYDVDLPGETQSESQYINVGTVTAPVDVPPEPVPALEETEPEPSTTIQSRDIAELLEAGIATRTTEPVPVAPTTTIQPTTTTTAPLSGVRTISTYTSPAGASR
ncbi:hypothetical protein ACFLY6_02540 [Candidatus Dependentiae bacterium]